MSAWDAVVEAHENELMRQNGSLPMLTSDRRLSRRLWNERARADREAMMAKSAQEIFGEPNDANWRPPQNSAGRADCKLSIARQMAISQGHNWERIDHKKREFYFTLAENILATVERKAVVRWR